MRTYKHLTVDGLNEYMKQNHLAETAVVGETQDSFLLQRGKSVKPVKKSHVESWMLDNGLVPGMGIDALSSQDKMIYEDNRAKNTVVQKEQKAKAAAVKDENLEAYYNQTKEKRLADAKHREFMKNEALSEPTKGIHYK